MNRRLIERADNGYELWNLGRGILPFAIKHMNTHYLSASFATIGEAVKAFESWRELPALVGVSTEC